MAPKTAQLITMQSQNLWTKVVQSKGWLSTAIVCFSVAKNNDLWDGFMDQRKVCGLVPSCGQDGYRAQAPQLPIDSYKSIVKDNTR